MLEQIEAIKQIFHFLVLALVQRGFCKSTLGARDTHAPQQQLCPPQQHKPRGEGERTARQPLLVSPQINHSFPLTHAQRHCRITSAPLASFFFFSPPWGNVIYTLS